ncbi:MAG: CDP-archaeol synthase [bacterium]|nr:MAG: CDP-archaeol synthase [bacterium]
MTRLLSDSTTLAPASCALFLIAAFVPAGFVHTLWLRSALSRPFATPLDRGRTFRGRRILGDNKTLSGFMALVPATGCTFYLLGTLVHRNPELLEGVWPLRPTAFGLLGLLAGLGFMLGELPNSFIKRQMGIGPGEPGRGLAAKTVFTVVDRIDSMLGMLLVLSLAVPVPLRTWLYVIVVGPFIHWFFSYLLFLLKVKGRPG